MIYKIQAPAYIHEKLDIIEGHTFSSIEKAESAMEAALKKADVIFKKEGADYKNSSGGTLLTIVKI